MPGLGNSNRFVISPWRSFREALSSVDFLAFQMSLLPDVQPERLARLKEIRRWIRETLDRMWPNGKLPDDLAPAVLAADIHGAWAYIKEDPRPPH